jgi:hypothetical protein
VVLEWRDVRSNGAMKHLDKALELLSDDACQAYEEAIELWITYGGD